MKCTRLDSCTCDVCRNGKKVKDEETRKKVLAYQRKHKEIYGGIKYEPNQSVTRNGRA